MPWFQPTQYFDRIVLALVAILLACLLQRTRKARSKMSSHENRVSTVGCTFVPWKKFTALPATDQSKATVIDCTHASADSCLTHHRQKLQLSPTLADDTSTGIVLNALAASDKVLHAGKLVSCNHFDVDGFLAVYCALQPENALKHEELLRAAARIGDFRELRVQRGSATSLDQHLFEYPDDAALKICCWLNSVEAQEFWRPFGKSETDPAASMHGKDKFSFFLTERTLSRFEELLSSLDPSAEEINSALPAVDGAEGILQREFDLVRQHIYAVQESRKVRHHGIGLAVLGPLQYPLHYYALFSATHGMHLPFVKSSCLFTCHRNSR